MVSKRNRSVEDDLNELLADTSPAEIETPFGDIDLPVDDAADQESATRQELLNQIHLKVRAELGRRQLRVSEALQLEPGSVVDLDKCTEDPVELYVNDLLLARAEVLVINDCFCLRITEVLPTPITRSDS